MGDSGPSPGELLGALHLLLVLLLLLLLLLLAWAPLLPSTGCGLVLSGGCGPWDGWSAGRRRAGRRAGPGTRKLVGPKLACVLGVVGGGLLHWPRMGG